MKYCKEMDEVIYEVKPNKKVATNKMSGIATLMILLCIISVVVALCLFCCKDFLGFVFLGLALVLCLCTYALSVIFAWYKRGCVYIDKYDRLVYDEDGVVDMSGNFVDHYVIYDVTSCVLTSSNLKLKGNFNLVTTVGGGAKFKLSIPYTNRVDVEKLRVYICERFDINCKKQAVIVDFYQTLCYNTFVVLKYQMEDLKWQKVSQNCVKS